MKAGAGLSTLPDTAGAAADAARAALDALEGRPADLAVVFASPHHAARADALLAAIHEVAEPTGLVGCVAESVLGGEREVEHEPGLAVWLAQLPGPVETFHMSFASTSSGGVFTGWRFDPHSAAPALHLLIADPFTFPVDHLLQHLNRDLPGTLAIGGMASGAGRAGETVLFRDGSVHDEGAVGVRLPSAVAVRTLVSQGCRPIGRPFVVTRSEGNVMFELGGRPPLERLRETVAELSPPDQELVSHGLHVGRVIDEYRAEHGLGDFLIRGVVGADPSTGAVAVGDVVEVGETIRFHVRDAATADEELRALLEAEVAGLPGRVAGALLFTCNGRGSRLFSSPDHDAGLVSKFLGGAPLAGFFCAGEIGPVGGRNFLHGFTASLAVFVES